jgi:ABC-2 type transport system ATP-binding protein
VAQGSPERLKSELRGDAVDVELADGGVNRRATAVVASIQGLHETQLDGRLLRARADDGAAAVPVLLGALEAAGIRVVAVHVARPSLDDVYLRHAGRRFEEADGAERRATAR